MSRSSLRLLPAISLIAFSGFAALASPAAAGVPDPRNSTAPPCFLACPSGDIAYTVIVRDVNNAPCENAFVQLNLCSCTTLQFCPSAQGGSPCAPSAISAADGSATFHVKAGGICPSGFGVVSADGVALAFNVQVHTVDLDGSLLVGAADLALATGQLGAPGGYADLDCSGIVGANDVATVQQHVLHGCNGPVPANSASWGQVKTIYR